MDILLNPNIAYLFLAGGLFFTITAVLSPGTGLLEIAAFVALIFAAWGVVNLPFNWWALIILLLGFILFYFAIFKTNSLRYLAAAIVALVIGSAFLFHDAGGWVPSVNPFLAFFISAFLAIYFWITARKTIEAEKKEPAQDLNSLLGKTGKVKESIPENDHGTVQIAGELWSAISDSSIPAGAVIRVVGREGFTLKVEKVQEEADK
jgi:membrane-bound serine protease (ClpP class)